MEPITISLGAALTVLGGIITATVGIIAIAKNFRKLPPPKDFSGNIEEVEKEIAALEKQVTELQSTLNGKIDTQIDSLNLQIKDLKASLLRFQDKLERLTDTIITHFSGKL